MATAYTIDVPAFSGPLDLLLHLIERDELDITAISLVTVTAQYLTQVEQLKGQRFEHLIDFLVIGARLVLIKSRALLPKSPTILIEESEEEEDPAAALARQLQRYKQFKLAANWLQEREELGLRTYLRVAAPPKLKKKVDLSGVTLEALRQAMLDALGRIEKSERSVAIVEKRRVTLEGKIAHLRHMVKKHGQIEFRELLSNKLSRIELSITLLAVLELIKRQEIQAHQPEPFGLIEIVEVSQKRET